jgi:hypothetical protein
VTTPCGYFDCPGCDHCRQVDERDAPGVPPTDAAFDAMLAALEHVASGKSGYLNKVRDAIALAKAARATDGVDSHGGPKHGN